MAGESELELSEAQAARIELALRSPSIDELASCLWKWRRGLAVESPAPAVLRQARELELTLPARDGSPRLTPLGAKLSDSLTEFVYWKQRGKRHHASREVRALHPESLRGKRILEVGCGAGVNLLSLQSCARVVGVDVEPLYLGFAAILARAESLPVPRVVCALAERLPFADGAFDVVLFPGSLPYMHIEAALREAARVLAPGGRVIAVQSDLAQTFGIRVRQRGWRTLEPRALLREARAFAGMAAYPWAGRLLVKPFAPIHVTRSRTRRWLWRAGLVPNARESCTVAQEACFVADKPGP